MSAKANQKRPSNVSPERVLEEVHEQSDDSDHESSRDLYVVEKIIDKRKYKGVVKYKVKWEGYPEEEATWEPLENLVNVQNLIEEFEKTKEKENQVEPVKEEGKKKVTKKDNKVSKPRQKQQKASTKKIKKDTTKEPASVLKEPAPVLKESANKESKTKVSAHKESSTEIVVQEVVNKESKSKDAMVEEKLPEHGHFKYGDTAKGIVQARQENDSIMLIVEWNPRKNGEVPQNTRMDRNEVRQYDKDLLIDFYETRIRFVKSAADGSTYHTPFKPSINKDSKAIEPIDQQKAVGGEMKQRNLSTVKKGGLQSIDKGYAGESVAKQSEATTRHEEEINPFECGSPEDFVEKLAQEADN